MVQTATPTGQQNPQNTTPVSRPIDVICQHTKEGILIPIKLRVQDEEGEFQTYTVKAYKDLSAKGRYALPNGVIATNSIHPFACKISVFGTLRVVTVYYNRNDGIWRLV